MYVCSCFGITEQQVQEHSSRGACTPRQIASACKAGTDCGGCVKRIQALLGRGACPRRTMVERGLPAPLSATVEPEPRTLPVPLAPQTPFAPAAPAPVPVPVADAA